MSSSGRMRAITPLFPWRPAILSPTLSLRFMAMYTFTSLITPGGSSSPLRSLAIFSSVIFSSTAIWRDVISSISSICSLSRGSLLARRMRFKSRDFIFSISSRVSSVSLLSRRLLVFSSCRSASNFLPSDRILAGQAHALQIARLHLLDQFARQLRVLAEQALVGLLVVQVGQQLLAFQQHAQAFGALVRQDADFILQIALQTLDLRFLDQLRPLVLLLPLAREDLAIDD